MSTLLSSKATTDHAEGDVLEDSGMTREAKTNFIINTMIMHQREFFAYVRKMTGNMEDAEDIMQITATKIIEKPENFDETRRVKPWLYAVLGNATVDYRRKNKRHANNVPANFRETPEEGHVSCHNQTALLSREREIGEAVETGELAEIALQELQKLNNDMRQSIEHWMQGMKYREIAAHIGVPIGTVKSRISLAITHLQKRLVEDRGIN